MINSAAEIKLYENNGKAVTSSRNIAEVFEKEHKNVLQTIQNLDCPIEFNELNFQPVEYTDRKGEKRPEYLITRDGFTLLAMGFTGSKAMLFKLKYIEAFNKMEKELRERSLFSIPQTYAEALETAAELAKRAVTLQRQIEDDKPKVRFAEAISSSPTSISISDFAKVLRQNGLSIGGKRLFEKFRKLGYLVSRGISRNSPMQRYVEQGLFDIKEIAVTVAGGTIISKATRITGKGQRYFANMFLNEKEGM